MMAQDGCRLVGKTLTISIYYIFRTRERLQDAHHWLVYFQTFSTCEPHWIIRRIKQKEQSVSETLVIDPQPQL